MVHAKSVNEVRHEIRGLLARQDYDALAERYRTDHSTLRLLIGMSYDRKDTLSWRAIDAAGRIIAAMAEDKGRNQIQRLLWMMREESGNSAWSAGDIIGEVIRNNAAPYTDVIPILISFHEEPLFLKSSLGAMRRIGETEAALVSPFKNVPLQYFQASDPQVRGLALLALLSIDKAAGEAALLEADDGVVEYYDGNGLIKMVIRDIVSQRRTTA